MKYAVLKVAAKFPELREHHTFVSSNISDTLQAFTPKFYNAFCQRHGGMVYLFNSVVSCTAIFLFIQKIV